jgi:photosystem II stability/assembly factor-like uncharacterized protein
MACAAVALILLSLVACDTEEEEAVPFSGPGEWAVLGSTGSPPLNLTLDGSELYVSAGAGGLFRLDVSAPGHDFERLGLANNAFGPYHGVSDVSVGGVILAATTAQIDQGDGTAAGLFRSADGGKTWTRSDAGMYGPDFTASPTYRLARSPHDPDIVIAGRGAAFRSGNGGQTWTLAYPDRLDVQALFFGVTWHPTRPDEVWAFGETNRFQPYLLRSTDGGGTWVSYSGLDELIVYRDNAFLSLAFAPSDPNTVWLGGQGAVFISEEGGLDWIRPEPMEPAFFAKDRFDHCRSVVPYPNRVGTAFALCGATVFFVEDEGARVYEVASPNEFVGHALLYDAGKDALYLAADDGVLRLQDPLAAPREPYDPRGWTRE